MTIDSLSLEERRKRCLEIVSYFKAGDLYLDEKKEDEMIYELGQLSPDPEISDFIFWPDRHGLSDNSTPEEIVEKAFSYKPIQL